jgi:iron complex outermembrane receptor protein
MRQVWIWPAGVLVAGLLLAPCGAAASATDGPQAPLKGGIQGTVLDPARTAVPGARVTVTNLTTGASVTAETDAQGRFTVRGLTPHAYQVAVRRAGFNPVTRAIPVRAGAPAQATFTLRVATVTQTVMVRAGAVVGATRPLSQAEVFEIPQTVRVIGRDAINALGPTAGAAQIIGIAPGVNVTGFGNTGATKSTITLNGIQQGWGGYGGFTTAGDLGVTFDGLPVADAATGLWQSNMFPQSTLINATTVTYGPGDPSGRWYNNVGGGVEFTPLQPTGHRHGSLSQTVGDYGQENTDFSFDTGAYAGWSAVVSGGHGSGHSYRVGYGDGFTNPQHDKDLYGKLIKQFASGTVQVGGFSSESEAYRPQVIPVADNPAITVTGAPGGALYSQTSSGFYSTLPYASYNKFDTNLMNLFWGKLNFALDPTTTLEADGWYERINRLHDRLNDVYNLGPQQDEWNNPWTKMFGERAQVQSVLPYNTVTAGVWFIHTLYDARNNFYNPADGGSNQGIANAGGKIRSSLFNQDMVAGYGQDRIQLSNWLTVTPGLNYFLNDIGYSNNVLQDFTFAPNVTTLPTHCYLNGTVTSSKGDLKIQSANCDARESRSGFEPSANVSIHPKSWFNLYGGYSEELKAPQVGGGGGLFQNVDPASYTLGRVEYTQAGGKVHFDQAGSLSRVLAGVQYFHMYFGDQELDIGLANGDTIFASASSVYNGVNAFFDADAVNNLHLFLNSTFERAHYREWGGPQSSGGFSGLPVSYVPNTILNIGASYDFVATESVVIQPRLWYQFTGSQTVFDNNAGAPSATTMPTFGTVNLGVNVPVMKYLNFRVTALNLFNKQYNQYEYVSSGGYFGTPAGGYLLAYPGAPLTVYGTFSVHF